MEKEDKFKICRGWEACCAIPRGQAKPLAGDGSVCTVSSPPNTGNREEKFEELSQDKPKPKIAARVIFALVTDAQEIRSLPYLCVIRREMQKKVGE